MRRAIRAWPPASAAAARRSRTWEPSRRSWRPGAPVDMGFGSGQGVKCYHSEHLYGEFWHRAFIVAPDTPLCNYLISCGANVEASGGVAGVWRHAKARVRGMKRVQVEPHLSVTGACSAQWVPIKPKTDAAFLYALIHVLLHELPRDKLDLPFLAPAHRVAVPGRPQRHLPARSRHPQAAGVGPGDRQGACRTTRPASPRRWRAAGKSTRSRSAPTRKCWPTASLTGETSFGKLLAHMQPYSPEWAEGVCDVKAGVIRKIAQEYSEHACVGQTIEIDGKTHAVPAGGGVAGQDRQQRLGRLRMLLGAHAAGRAWSARSRCRAAPSAPRCAWSRPMSRAAAERQARSRRLHALPAEPDRQGALVAQAQHPQRLPHHGAAGGRRPLEPGAGPDPFLLDVPGRHAGRACRASRLPDVWFVYRTNPAISFWDTHGPGREDGALPVRRRLRLHPRRDQPFRRRAAARGDRPGKPAADPHRRHQVHRAVLGPRGLRPAPAGGGRARRGARLHRDRQRTGAAHRPHRQVRRLHQQGRRRRAAQGRAMATSRWTPARSHSVRRDLGRGLQGRQRRAERRRRHPRAGLVEGARPGDAAVPAERLVPVPHAGRARPALRAALPGAAGAGGRRARPPPARERHALVGHAARGIPGAAQVQGFQRALAGRRDGGGRQAAGLSVLAAHRAQHAVRVGRQRRACR